MKKHNIITSLALAFVFLPLYAGAQSAPANSVPVSAQAAPATEAQIFTACSQASIEARDNAIGAARNAYNVAMATALGSRKDAEKGAVALDDAGDKKEAIRAAVEEYKKSVTSAQEKLTKERKEAWSAFEANTNKCREISKEARSGAAADKKADLRTMQAEQKAESEDIKKEVKTLRESFLDQIDSLRNFFKKGASENK